MSLNYFGSSTTEPSNLKAEKSALKKKIKQLIEYIKVWRNSELHCITFYRGFLFYQGLLPRRTVQSANKLVNLYRTWIPQLTTSISYYNMIFGMPYFIYITWGNDPRLTLETVGAVFVSAVIFSHYISLVYRGGRIESMFQALEEMREYGKLLPSQNKDIEEQTRKWSERTLVVLAGAFLGIASFLILIPNALAKREFVYYAWYPFEEKQSPLYEVIFVVTIIVFAYGALNTACNFILLLVLLLEAIGQLKLLSYNLENVLASNPAKKPSERSASNVGSRVNSNVKDENIESSLTNTCVTIAYSKHQENFNVSACVQHHQRIIRFVGEIETSYSLVFITLIGTILLATSLGVKLSLHSEAADKAAVMGIGLVLLINLCMAMLCWLTDAVAEESELLRDAIFGSDWLESSDSFKRSMRIILSRSNQPLLVKVGGFIPLTLPTYYRVMKLTYSYCTTLLELSPK